ncbi:MAG: hypothetical protein RL497_1597 [Pseudomonadota bacterium]
MQATGLKQRFERIGMGWIYNLGAQFFRDYRAAACQDQAAALTYMSLFALVPLMTVTYAVFSMVPEFTGVAAKVQKFMFMHFVPESGAVIQSYFASFSKQAQKLTWLGALFLAVTAFLMLGNIERTFNTIWGVRRGRRGLNKWLLYWAVLSVGPLLIGTAFALSTYFLSFKYWVLGSAAIPSPLVAVFPVLLTATAFSLLFIAVPNCTVPLKYGVTGGVLAAVGFELLKWLFSLVVANANFKFIYGAFAALPLFLLWVNFLWMTVLSGAVLVRILAEKRYVLRRDGLSDLSAALVCLALLRASQLSGKPLDELAVIQAGVDQHHWQRLRDKWLNAGWLSETRSGHYVLYRDLAVCTLLDLSAVMDLRMTDLAQVVGQLPQFPALEQHIKPIEMEYNRSWAVPILMLITVLPIAGS